MRIASVAEIKAQLKAYLKASEEGPVVVTRNGKPVAVLLGVEDEAELESAVLAYSRQFRSVLEAACQQIREGRGIPHDQLWEEVKAETGG
jgi:prevent-host-death family protein